MRSFKTGFVFAHTDSDGDFFRQTGQKIRRFDAIQYPFANKQTAIEISAWQNDTKLVSTEPEHEILRSDRGTEDSRQGLEDAVSDDMPVHVIYSLEAIYVEHKHRQWD